MSHPIIERDDYWADFLNSLFMRPVYRKPFPSTAKHSVEAPAQAPSNKGEPELSPASVTEAEAAAPVLSALDTDDLVDELAKRLPNETAQVVEQLMKGASKDKPKGKQNGLTPLGLQKTQAAVDADDDLYPPGFDRHFHDNYRDAQDKLLKYLLEIEFARSEWSKVVTRAQHGREAATPNDSQVFEVILHDLKQTFQSIKPGSPERFALLHSLVAVETMKLEPDAMMKRFASMEGFQFPRPVTTRDEPPKAGPSE